MIPLEAVAGDWPRKLVFLEQLTESITCHLSHAIWGITTGIISVWRPVGTIDPLIRTVRCDS